MSKKKKKDKAEEVKKEKPKAPKKVAVKAVVKAAAKPKKAAAAKKPSPPAVEISSDDIALRAYFLAERRQQEGIPGDEHSDWIEAERQLRAEAGL